MISIRFYNHLFEFMIFSTPSKRSFLENIIVSKKRNSPTSHSLCHTSYNWNIIETNPSDEGFDRILTDSNQQEPNTSGPFILAEPIWRHYSDRLLLILHQDISMFSWKHRKLSLNEQWWLIGVNSIDVNDYIKIKK